MTTQQATRRSPIYAAIASAVIWGLGSIYAGQVWKGLGFLAAAFVIGFSGMPPRPELIVGLAVAIGSVVEGFRDAQKWNRHHGITS
jgi:TM2 domain-containing membrane protein YozV